MKNGFTILELLFGVFFSSLISGILYLAFFQAQRARTIATDIMSLDTRFSIINDQLERDLSGVFVPARSYIKTQTFKAAQDKEPFKPLEKVFWGINKGELIADLSFITNNPVKIYEYADNTLAKPHVVRVYYRLIPDGKRNDSFRLYRSEGLDLDISNYKEGGSVKNYELADNIKEMKILYVAGTTQKEKKQEPLKFEELKEWKLDEKVQDQPKIPFSVIVTISLWDNEHASSRDFTFEYPIYSFFAEIDRITKPQSPLQLGSKQTSPSEQTDKKKGTQKSTSNKISLVPKQNMPHLELPSMEEMKKMVQQLASQL